MRRQIWLVFMTLTMAPLGWNQNLTWASDSKSIQDLIAEHVAIHLSASRDGGYFDRQQLSIQISQMNLKDLDLPQLTWPILLNDLQEQKKNPHQLVWLSWRQIPESLYAAAPTKWISFIVKELGNKEAYNCKLYSPRSCSEDRDKGRAIEAVIGFVADGVHLDTNISESDKKKLLDALYPYYKDLELDDFGFNKQIQAGMVLWNAAFLEDPRAVQKALDLLKEFLARKRILIPSGAYENFEDAAFALGGYYYNRKSRPGMLLEPTCLQVMTVLTKVLNSEKVSEDFKKRLRDFLDLPAPTQKTTPAKETEADTRSSG